MGICLPLVSIVIGKWLGLAFSGLSIAVVLGIVGIASLPTRPSRRIVWVISAVAVLSIAANWAYPPSAAVLNWEHALQRG